MPFTSNLFSTHQDASYLLLLHHLTLLISLISCSSSSLIPLLFVVLRTHFSATTEKVLPLDVMELRFGQCAR